MVELILSEAQLACLKAAVTVGSEESAALGRGTGVGAKAVQSGALCRPMHTGDRGPTARRSPAVLSRCRAADSCRDRTGEAIGAGALRPRHARQGVRSHAVPVESIA